MDKSKQSKLQLRFPMLYRDIGKSGTCMYYGLSVGDGWFDLLWDLSEDLEKLDPLLVTSQVKEKFGTMRFYLVQSDLEMRHESGQMFSFAPQANNEHVRVRISQAEKESASVCEKCGAAGKLRNDGYVHVSCDVCEKPNQT